MLRILIVDDSSVARNLLKEILSSEPDFEVVGEATNGAEAVSMVEKLKPDIVTMDVQMPRMNGYAATREIMTTHPTPIVVVSGSAGQEDVEKSMQSLDAGALTVVGKPPSPTSTHFEEQCAVLVSTLRTMAAVKVIRRYRLRDSVKSPREEFASRVNSLTLSSRPRLVTIAASTGGPQALRAILETLPATFPVPIVIVQHISDGFTQGLIDWLNGATAIEVTSATAGQKLKAGVAYIAPEKSHCGVTADGTIVEIDRAPFGGFRPSATVLFESASREFGRAHLAVILTGMGSDGVDGLRSVRQTGGSVIAQDEASCIVYGMPKAAIEAGLANVVIPLDAIGAELIRFVTDEPP
jgi:two-component system, chemotaxis family, protein-glutamate methylesterase/glutaminase